jgi:hypothetical protein
VNEYSISRPKTRADCRAEARPCPWVGCRYHLLADIADSKPRAGERAPRPTSIRLITSSKGGRRRGLRSSAAVDVVRGWIDDAVEQLSRLEYTCALDVADAFPEGIPTRRLARILWVTRQQAETEARAALARSEVRAALNPYEDHTTPEATGAVDHTTRHGRSPRARGQP